MPNNVQDCIFCKIVKGEEEVSEVYEDNEIMAFLDINPLTVGHTLIIPKAHYKDITDIPEELLRRISDISKELGVNFIRNLGYDGINIMHSTGRSAGQSVFHFHVHILPRKTGESIGFQEWWFSRAYHPDRSELDKIAKTIRIK